MAKLKDGFYKLLGNALGDNNHVLLAGGESKLASEFIFPTKNITPLTGYTKVQYEDISKAKLLATDSLNAALDKLEYKADLGVNAFNKINMGTDPDKIINTLNEIIKAFGGITEDETILDKFIPRAGTLSGKPITGVLAFINTDGIKLKSENKDLKIWEIHGGTEHTYGFHELYKGTADGNDNSLILYSHALTGTHVKVREVKLDGSLLLYTTTTFSSTPFVNSTKVSLEGHTHDDRYYTKSQSNANYVNVTGDTMTGPLVIKGTAASKPLMTRNIIGSDGDGKEGPLYIQYGNKASDTNIYLGSGGGYSISADGGLYSGNSATATTAGKLSTVSKTAWGLTFWTSGGVPTSISGTMTDVGSIYLLNQSTLLAKNSSGVNETWMWPRWSDNNMYMNYGSAGFYIRNNDSVNVIRMLPNGSVGIGIDSPSQKLTVNGNVLASGFIKSGSSNSYVLLGGGSHKAISDFSMSHSHPYWPLKGSWISTTLKNAGYTRVCGITDSTGNGEFALAYKDNIINPYTDGHFYQNEGLYRCMDTSDASISGLTITINGVSTTWKDTNTWRPASDIVGGKKSIGHDKTATKYTAAQFYSTYVKKDYAAWAERGSWNYAGNGQVTTDFGNIHLAGTSIFAWGGDNSYNTTLYITPLNSSGVENPLHGEMLFYSLNGSGYTAGWRRVLTNTNYNLYALPLTGGTITGKLIIKGTHEKPKYTDDKFTSGLIFDGGDNQIGSLVWTSYDSYRWPAGLVFSGNQGNEWIEAPRFIKTGSSKDYVLLGDGEHKAISDFSLSNHNHDSVYLKRNGTNSYDSSTLTFSTSTMNIESKSGSWWLKISVLDTSDKNVHRFTFNERQGSGDYIELFGVDGNGALFAKNNKVWHAGNDGSGSGLDADLLDGKHASAFASVSHSHSYLTTNYVGGVKHDPLTYFSNTIGLKVAMTGHWKLWSDTLWINGYSGSDVPSMCALHFMRDGTPRIGITTQQNTATTYGTMYEIWSTYNFDPDNKANSFTGATAIAAHYSTLGTTSGILVKVPHKWSDGASWMISFTLRIYLSYLYYDIVFSGYNYGNSKWYSPKAEMIAGSASLLTKMGWNDDGYLYVWVKGGNYTGATVFNVNNGFHQRNFNSGWEITNAADCPNPLFNLTLLPISHVGHTHSYLPLSGGKMTGSIKFQDSSLPSKNLSYVCGIDAFGDGGEMGWQTASTFVNKFAPTKTGGGASGTWNINITGSASHLSTSRTIFGQSFNGAADVKGKAFVYGKKVNTGSGYYNGALEIREADLVGSTLTSDLYAPRIGFHWANRLGYSLIATTSGFKFLNLAETGYVNIAANGFIKAGSNSNYLLLGDGGHKAISDFATSGHNHDGRYLRTYEDNITNIDTLTSNYLYSKYTGGFALGAKPGIDNAVAVLNLHTHTGNYYSQIAVGTSNNSIYIRSTNTSGVWGNWDLVLTKSTFTTIGNVTGTMTTALSTAWKDVSLSPTLSLSSGTYIVQVSVNNTSAKMTNCYFSGIMSWWNGNTTDAGDAEGDEIILHRAGLDYDNTIYLRTVVGESGKFKLLIAANTSISTQATYTFKFKKLC